MKYFDKLAAFLDRFIVLSEKEKLEFSSCFTEVFIKKKQFITQPNFVSKHRTFVTNGAFRAYVVNELGEEVTIQFAIEDWWILDYNSYIFQQPATMFIVALEDSVVLQLDYESELKLKNSNFKYETIFRMAAERAIAFMYKRIITNLTQSAEERYDTFMENYNVIAARVPQYALASYLNMTAENLSRIRNKKVKKLPSE